MAFGLSIVLFVVALFAIVMIHEGGHYLGARIYNFRILEYFIGFGPRLWSFRRGEIEYGVKAIPAGGYVKIAGMNPFENDVPPGDEDRAYGAKPVRQRIVVILAGPMSHFLVAWLIFAAVFLALDESACVVGAELAGCIPALVPSLLFERIHHFIEPVDKARALSSRVRASQRRDEIPVVPQLLVAPGVEPRPQTLAHVPIVDENCPRVVQLVGSRHPSHLDGRVAKVREAGLPFAPAAVAWARVGIGASLDDPRHARAELGFDFGAGPSAPALVLDRVVQQCSHRLILVPSMIDDERRNAKKVRGIRDGRAFANLIRV